MPPEALSQKTDEESVRPLQTPEIFTSIAEARDFFEDQVRRCVHEYHRALTSVPPDMVGATSDVLLRKYARLLDEITLARTRFEQSRGASLTNKERMGIKMLKIYQLRHTFLFGAGHFKTTGVENWETLNPIFEEIVSLAASIVETTTTTTTYETEDSAQHSMSPGGTTTKPLKPSFSLDNGVIGPLYDVATLCRDPILRRRAVDLLRSAPRREGVFDSQLYAIVAEKIIAVEEAVAAAQADGVNDINDLKSLIKDVFLGTSTRQESQEHSESTKSSEVPSAVRLTDADADAYPSLDIGNRKMILIVVRQEETEPETGTNPNVNNNNNNTP